MIGVSLRVLIVPATVVRLTRAAPTLATGGRLFSPDLFFLQIQYNLRQVVSCHSFDERLSSYMPCFEAKLSTIGRVLLRLLRDSLSEQIMLQISRSIEKLLLTHKQQIFLRTPLPVSERRVRSGAGARWLGLCTDQLLS